MVHVIVLMYVTSFWLFLPPPSITVVGGGRGFSREANPCGRQRSWKGAGSRQPPAPSLSLSRCHSECVSTSTGNPGLPDPAFVRTGIASLRLAPSFSLVSTDDFSRLVPVGTPVAPSPSTPSFQYWSSQTANLPRNNTSHFYVINVPLRE